MNTICLDGKLLPAGQPNLVHDNRAFRYGDSVFETLKIQNGKIALDAFHFDRLFSSLALLQYTLPVLFTKEKLEMEMLRLCEKNKCGEKARVRLTVFRGHGGLYDDNKTLNYLIECWSLPETVNQFNENGLVIGIYPDARKSCDRFSNIKSGNFMPYTMAALYAKEHQLNDCLVLNTRGHIADATIANVFLVHGQEISTPALSEGCVNGVLRRWLLEKYRETGNPVRETSIGEQDLATADEVFLTNAIQGIRWVGRCEERAYTNTLTREIYNDYKKTFY